MFKKKINTAQLELSKLLSKWAKVDKRPGIAEAVKDHSVKAFNRSGLKVIKGGKGTS